MEVLVVNQSEVPKLLPMDECMEVMVEALKGLARGEAVLPLRPTMYLPGRTDSLVMMPAYLGNLDVVGLKVITYFPGNQGTKHDTHQGGVMLFDTSNGSLLALIDATEITAIRTPAVTGVATDLLARPEASTLAMIGSGTQARGHLEAMLLVRPIREVRVWALPLKHAQAFAERESDRYGLDINTKDTAESAVRGADIVCTTTSAKDPVLFGEWLEPGMHVNAIGSSIPFTRELDTQAVVMSKMFVDRKESAVNEAGDYLMPKEEGAIDESHIRGEIGELLLGRIEGRISPDEITLYKSLGLAIEDLASAYHIYKTAKEKGLGTWLELGGGRRETP